MDRILLPQRKSFIFLLLALFYSYPGKGAYSLSCHKMAALSENSTVFMSDTSRRIVEWHGSQGSSNKEIWGTTRGWSHFRNALRRFIYDSNGVTAIDYGTLLFSKLGKNDVILDAGSGDSFLSDMLFDDINSGPYSQHRPEDLPSYIGITHSLLARTMDFFKERIASGRFHIEVGKFFEQVDIRSLLKPGQRIRIIADSLGILSYTDRPDLILKKFLDVLENDGLLVIAGDPRIHFNQKKEGFFSLAGYLKSIDGLDVAIEGSDFSTLVVSKNGRPIRIPELQRTTTFDVGTLPRKRYFRLTGNFLED